MSRWCVKTGSGENAVGLTVGAGVCGCRSMLWRVDEGADGGAPGCLRDCGALGLKVKVPFFLIIELMMSDGDVFAS